MTQKEQILEYMRDFGSVSPLEAYRDLGIMRLSARIYDIVKDGYIIKRETETAANRYGAKVTYTRYSIEEEGNE